LASYSEGRTAHLSPTVCYFTPTETTDIRGDQAAARTIFIVAEKKSGSKSKTTKAISEESLPEKKKLKLIAAK